MYSIDVFLEGCELSPRDPEFECYTWNDPGYSNAERLEKLTFGYISAEEWEQRAEREFDPDTEGSWVYDTDTYLQEYYLYPMWIGIQEVFGIPINFWHSYDPTHTLLSRRQIEKIFEEMDVYASAIADGIPIEDVFA